MVALHWGLEYMHAPTTDQLAVAHELTAGPGHRLHLRAPRARRAAVRPGQRKWVVYGLGNAVAQQGTEVEGVYDGNTAG